MSIEISAVYREIFSLPKKRLFYSWKKWFVYREVTPIHETIADADDCAAAFTNSLR